MTRRYDFSIVKLTKMLRFLLVAEAHGLIYPRPSGENFSFTKPIYELLKTIAASTKSGMSHLKPTKRKESNKAQVPSKTPVVWEGKHKQALNVLTVCLTSTPVMAYPQPFILPTDASEECLGSVLYQKLDGKMHHEH